MCPSVGHIFLLYTSPMTRTLTPEEIETFRSTVYGFYHKNRREFPWRDTTDPYAILVSEIMLQQTQVERVREKYVSFLARFPSVSALAQASLAEVLIAWQGLGYNRRAKFLHGAAQQLLEHRGGEVPPSLEALIALPGIGHNTAAAICAYAFNLPVVYVETNIRTTYIHHFFEGTDAVSDADILALVSQTLDAHNPRGWYSALMDYGTFLKETIPGLNERSKHYTKQSPFKGSRREVRGWLLRELGKGNMSREKLFTAPIFPEEVLGTVVEQLVSEGFICEEEGLLRLG